MGKAIRNRLFPSIGESKYYSIFLGCTSDDSLTEQITIIICFDSCTNEIVEINQNFLGFDDSTGRGLYETIIVLFWKWHISIKNIKRQGYDNAASTKGKKNGLQNILLTINDAVKVNSNTTSFLAN